VPETLPACQQARTNGDLDWYGILEEFAQLVFEAERTCDPTVYLRTLQLTQCDDEEIKLKG
jgi:hypothetical protein